MPSGGTRPGAGRPSTKIDMGLPPRKRGRPTKAALAERAAAEARYHAELQGLATGGPVETAGAHVVGEAPIIEAIQARPQASATGKIVAYTPQMPPDVSPRDYLLTLMRDPKVAPERRDKAAALAIAYVDAKPGEKKLGKKEQKLEDAAAVASGGTFAPGRPPLSVVKGGG